MDDMESSGFKMSNDDEDADTEYEEQVGDLRISKLSQRVTIITILIPCLFGALLLFAYLNMKKDVDTTFISEAEEVQKLSDVLDSRLSALSLENKSHEEHFTQKLNDIDGAIGSLKGKVEKNRKRANSINAAKASKKTVSSSVSKIDASITGLQQDVAALSQEIKALDGTLKGELGRITEALDQQKETDGGLRKELKALAVLVEDRQRTLQRKLNQVEKTLKDKLRVVEKKISKTEGTPPKIDSSPRMPPGKVVSPVPRPIPARTDTPDPTPAAPRPGTIIEQDID
jgi:DNA repair exonuclease SbcCD ATPase subunit